MNHHLLFTFLLVLYGPEILCANAYRIGDAVGILLRTHTTSNGSATLEAYRHQLPRFGVSTKTRFDVSSLLNPDDLRLSGDSKQQKRFNTQQNEKKSELNTEHLRLSLSFDEGFHHIPWFDIYNPSHHNEKTLQSLVITIVYSGSDGSIHAVHHKTEYQDASKGGRPPRDKASMPKSFTVEYAWVNEADVDVQGGLLALFVAVLVVSLINMIGACTTSSSGDEYDGHIPGGKRLKEKHSSSSVGIGSSDGFTKSL